VNKEIDRLLAPYERQLEAVRDHAAASVRALCARHLERISRRMPGRVLTARAYLLLSIDIDPPVPIGDAEYRDLGELIRKQPSYFKRAIHAVKEDYDAIEDHVNTLERRMGCIIDDIVMDPDADIQPLGKAA